MAIEHLTVGVEENLCAVGGPIQHKRPTEIVGNSFLPIIDAFCHLRPFTVRDADGVIHDRLQRIVALVE